MFKIILFYILMVPTNGPRILFWNTNFPFIQICKHHFVQYSLKTRMNVLGESSLSLSEIKLRLGWNKQFSFAQLANLLGHGRNLFVLLMRNLLTRLQMIVMLIYWKNSFARIFLVFQLLPQVQVYLCRLYAIMLTFYAINKPTHEGKICSRNVNKILFMSNLCTITKNEVT